ncbi:MAG: PhzF family phenazine biosynthesis protein [Candidatus Electryonea clarkiae]|nr:PhzF family phenazine biosynthesis protein [Candidatus Electryonea clarkiae]MDP8287829.1 PhzF family phenazine biosynthesis protein [Candidatus Electryonea clarkiae]
MTIPIYQVDAFTNIVFGGNPAAVCCLEEWLDDEILQDIALENNLSETAFLVKAKEFYELRWFTPTTEVDLCGHATLAAAYVIFEFIESDKSLLKFSTQSGMLSVRKTDDMLTLDFPSRKPSEIPAIDDLTDALGSKPAELWKASRDLMAVFENESQIRGLKPNFEKLKQLPDTFAVIVTAKGNDVDFTSRFFAPRVGINEDPVTGSAHCTLIPYWSERLGKNKLHALQVSDRGGELFCEDCNDRVLISGKAVLYLKGNINI